MFGKKDRGEVAGFVSVLAQLAEVPPQGLTKTQIACLKTLADRADAAGPISDMEALRAALAPKKAARPARKPSAGGSKAATKPATTPALVEKLLGELEAAEHDKARFDALVDEIAKAHRADTLKKLATGFAPGARAATAKAAVTILKSERNDRRRAEQKAQEAANSTPW